nr:hypothetical protein [uncultured Acetatifactor sp.]
MAQYDGSIRIRTGIDTKEFKAGSKEIESEARRMAKTVSKDLGDSAKIALQKQTDAFVKQNQQYAAQEQKIKDLGATLHELQRTGLKTPIFKQTSKDLASAEKKLDGLYGTLRNLEAEGKENSAPYKHAIVQIDIYKKKVSELQNQLKELKYSGEAYTPADTSKIESEIAAAEKKQMQMYTALQTSADALTSKISQSVEKESERSNKLAEEVAEEERLAAIRENAVVGNQRIVEAVERRKQLLQEIADMEAAEIGPGYQQFDSAQQELASLNQEIKDYANSTAEMKSSYVSLGASVKQAFLSMGRGIANIPIATVKAGVRGLSSAFQKLGGIVKKVATGPFKFLGNVAKNVFSKITKSSKQSNGAMSSFGTRLKSLALSALIFNQVSKALNSLISGIKEGFGNLYKEVGGFKSSVDGLKASALTLKNSLAAAFRPLVEAAIPYIQVAIDYITRLADSFGQLVAAITGQKTYTRAIKQTASAFDDSAKAADDAKEAAEGYLSPLDEINKYSDGKDKKISSGDAGESSGTGQMFEEVPIESRFSEFVDKLKSFIKSEDWEGLGAYIANGINAGLQKIYDVINWDNVGPQITYFVTAFTETFNSLVDNLDWDLLGRTIGAGINTIVNTLYLLITGIDWVNLGSKLAEGLNGLASEVDAEKIGNLIGEKFMILPRILLGFVSNLDWASIGNKVGSALNGVVSSIDLSQVGEMLGKGLTGLFQMAINFAATFDWKALGTNIYQGINSFFANTDWATVGQGISDFVMGILDTILVAVQGIDWAEVGRSIVDFILNIDWIGLAVKLLEIGVYLIGGLLEGILAALAGIGEWIKENVFDPIVNWFKELFGIHSPSTVMAELGGYLVMGLIEGIKNLVGKVEEIWESMKQFAVDTWNGVKDWLSGTWSSIKQTASQKWGEIKQNLSEKWSQMKSDAKSKFDEIGTNIANAWAKTKENTASAWSTIKEKAVSASDSVKTGVMNAWNALKTGTSNVWDSIMNAVKRPINGILGFVESLANGVVNGINTVIRALNRLSFDIPDWIPLIGGNHFGFNIPELGQVPIPRLATGAVIPANKEFLAVLGDQKHGTNIEAPLDTIKQAQKESILEVLSALGITGAVRTGNSQPKEIVLKVDRRELGRVMIDEGKLQLMSTGKNMFMLGTT